jgi:ABC-type multidrug transport system ATPase subunit
LDEPTSGLDAFTAFSILQVLKCLASEGRTVISTIHQSRSDLFAHFGNILLLTKGGRVAYSGKAEKVLPYFSELGYECPSMSNPADFVLDLVSVDLRDETNEAISREKVKHLTDRFQLEEPLSANTSRTISLPAELNSMRRDIASFHVAYPILLKRGVINITRQTSLIYARVGQVVGLGGILALYLAPLKNDYYSIQNRADCIQAILPREFSPCDPFT